MLRYEVGTIHPAGCVKSRRVYSWAPLPGGGEGWRYAAPIAVDVFGPVGLKASMLPAGTRFGSNQCKRVVNEFLRGTSESIMNATKRPVGEILSGGNSAGAIAVSGCLLSAQGSCTCSPHVLQEMLYLRVE